MTLRRKAMGATALAIFLLAGPAFAQQADAKAEFDAGQKLFDGGRQADALPHFRAAFEASKSPNARLMVARCLVALGKTAEAYEEMATTTREATARAEADPKYVRTRDSAAAEMAMLERRVGKLVVALADPGVGAAVTLDGAPLGPSASASPSPCSPEC
jgi:thioredoxin-like negative regulator of GroEL